jgi:metal-responsive CopG/Arc/MetJ family transcriptional regulator
MKRIAASVPDQLYASLDRLAEQEGRSLSNLISYLLERSIDERLKLHGGLTLDRETEVKP